LKRVCTCTLLSTHVLCTLTTQPTKQEAGSKVNHSAAAAAAASERPAIVTEVRAMHYRFGQETNLLRRQDRQQLLQPVVTFEWLKSIGVGRTKPIFRVPAVRNRKIESKKKK